MRHRFRFHISIVLLTALGAAPAGWTEESTPGQPEIPMVAPLTKAEMDASSSSNVLTLPMPGEFFSAIGKRNRPDWSLFYRAPLAQNYSNRAQIALNLGGLIADGYIAVEAQDGQQVKNIGKDIVTLAKALGVSKDVLSRGNSISDFAENNEWNALKEELEATQNDVRSAMAAMDDQDLIILLNLGGWIRGTEVVSSVIAQNYTPEDARLLRQPAIIRHLAKQIDLLPQALQDEPLIAELRKKLLTLQSLVSYPIDHTPAPAEAVALRTEITSFMPLITTPTSEK